MDNVYLFKQILQSLMDKKFYVTEMLFFNFVLTL